MTAPFFLIVLYINGDASSMTSTPMQSLEICEFAAVQAKRLEGTLSTIKTQCVRGEVVQ
ncbi:hypothetical protein PS870_06442 [Pseudomonas fluorescens]|uniref:Uncharacterized protein n=1 Tax=Pseudomonas fluorescens TaxID=294 RepID=A0A5E7QHP6_PSEFL|nr:hypothetical protein [Pseudomonas fluorescens]VVP61772.1 hypothetical protein PS870_06442 [Pseudomonas fluorescens]